MNTHAANRPRWATWQRSAAVLNAWLKAPSEVASVCPSSPILTQTIADRACIQEATSIVDLGPGTGGTTAAILQHARPDCRVLAIEKMSEFIPPLKAIGDPRLTVQQGDAVGLQRLLMMNDMTKPDVIVSGIPFSSIDPMVAKSMIRSIHGALADNGVFLAYQLRGHVTRYAQTLFNDPVSDRWVLLNLPPLRICTWQKLPSANTVEKTNEQVISGSSSRRG